MSKLKSGNRLNTLNKLVVAVLSLGLTATTYSATLIDAVNQTLVSHPDILSAQSEQNAAAYDIRQAQGGWLPSFDVSAGVGHEYTNNIATRGIAGGGVNMNRQESQFLIRQLLFDGGNVANQIRQAKADYGTRTFQVAERRELLGFGAAEAYLNVLRNRELVTIAEFDVKAHEDLYVKVAKRLKAGAGRKSELQLADSRLALSESQLDSARGKLYDAENTYIKTIGSAPATVMELPRPPTNIPKSLEEAQRIAMGVNPAIHATDEQIAANQAAAGIAQSAYYPTVTLDVSASFNDSLDGVRGYNNERQEMVRMTYNVFNGGSDKAAVTAAAYRVVVAENDSANIRRDTNETVALAWNDLQANMNRLPSLQTHVTQSYNVWQAYEKQFQLGQRTLFDLLNAQSEYYDARGSLTDAEYDVRVGRYRLLGAMGNFVATMQNTNRNVYRNPYKKVWEPMKEVYAIEQASPASAAVASPVNMSNRLATGDAYGAATPNPVDNYKISPAVVSAPKADVTGGNTSKVRAQMAAEANASPFAATAPDAVLPGAAGSPAASGAASSPAVGGAASSPAASGAANPPAVGGAASSPAVNGAANPPAVGGAASSPTGSAVPAVLPDASRQPSSIQIRGATPPPSSDASDAVSNTVPNQAASTKHTKWFSWGNHSSQSAMDMANNLAQQPYKSQPQSAMDMANSLAEQHQQNTAARVTASSNTVIAKEPLAQQASMPALKSSTEKLSQSKAPALAGFVTPAAAPIQPQVVDISSEKPASDKPKQPKLSMHQPAQSKQVTPAIAGATVKHAYTVQLLAAREKSTLVQYAHQHHLPTENHIFQTHNNLGDWYVLTYGQYPTIHSAKLARANLPKSLSKSSLLIKDESKLRNPALA